MGWGGGRFGGQGGCERRIEVFVKIQKIKFGGGGWGVGGEVGLGGQAGCERRIEVLGKFERKIFGGGGGGVEGGGVGLGGGVRVDVNEKLKFL